LTKIKNYDIITFKIKTKLKLKNNGVISILSKTNKIYKNKDIIENKKYTKRRNEIITNRLLIVFGLSVCIVSFFVYAMGITWMNIQRLLNITFAGLITTGVLFLLSLIFLVYKIKTGADESDKTINSKNLLAVISFLLFADFLIYFTYQVWIPFLTAFTISLTMLVYIYYLYQKEFFLFSLFTAISCFLLYFAQSPLISLYLKMGFLILTAAFAVIVLVFSLLLMKNKGDFLRVNILDKKANYFQFYILSAFLAACVVLSFLAVNFFYLICAVLVYFVVAGIYFTVKMI